MRRTRTLTNEALIARRIRGIRPAPGYPACPEHTVKADMFEMLQAEEIGMQLTESYRDVSGRGGVGLLLRASGVEVLRGRQDRRRPGRRHGRRRGMAKDEVERYLAPNL